MARQQNQGESSNNLPTPIEVEARRLADEHQLSEPDEQRAAACLALLVRAFDPSLVDRLDDSHALSGFPFSLLDYAIRSFGFNYAAEIIEKSDLPALCRLVQVTEYLFAEQTPFYTIAELARSARDFADFLRTHRRYLLETGLPPQAFPSCHWLYVHLGRLYDTRATVSPYPYEKRPIRPHDALRRTAPAPYQWVRYTSATRLVENEIGPIYGDEILECKYQEASLLEGMHPDDANRIETDRQRVFDVKVRIVDLLADAADQGNAIGLWEACLAVLEKAFNKEELEFYFARDRFYLRTDALDGLEGEPNPQMSPGGLSNLFEVIGHFEAELTHGLFNQVKSALPDTLIASLVDGSAEHRWLYFKILGQPTQHLFDDTIKAMLSSMAKEQAWWRKYRERLQEALEREFRVWIPIEAKSHYAHKLQGVLQILADQMQQKIAGGTLLIDPQSKNIFRKDGNSWTIQFDGKIISKPHSDGLFYIAQMLQQPNKPFASTHLRALKVKWEADPQGWLRKGAAQAILAGVQEEGYMDQADILQAPAYDLGNPNDDETKKNYEKRLEELKKLHKEASSKGNELDISSYITEINALNESLNKAQGFGGRNAKVARKSKNDNDAVRNAVDRVLEDLAEAHPALHEHFRQTLVTGTTNGYSPRPMVDWEM